MCNSNNQHQQNNREDFQQWQGMYPDLSSLLGEKGTNRPSLVSILLTFLGINTNSHYSNTSSTEGPAPTAPPPSPGPGSTPSRGPGSEPGSGPGSQWNHTNQHFDLPQPDILSLLVARVTQFSAVFARSFVVLVAVILFLTLVSLLPNSLLYTSVYILLAAGLGLHLPTLVAGHVLYSLLTWWDPLLLTLVSIWAVHKMVIRRKPLVDVQLWKRRLAGMEINNQF